MSSLLLLPTFYGFSLPTGADDVSIVEARLDPWHPQPLLVRFALRRQIREAWPPTEKTKKARLAPAPMRGQSLLRELAVPVIEHVQHLEVLAAPL